MLAAYLFRVEFVSFPRFNSYSDSYVDDSYYFNQISVPTYCNGLSNKKEVVDGPF